MAHWEEKTRVEVGKVSLELPTTLVNRKGDPIDSAANMFEGEGVAVIVDQGPFADRLTSYVGLPEFREDIINVAGTSGHTIFFRSPDGSTYTVAIHLPMPQNVTVVVKSDSSVPKSVPREIIESLRPIK
jgi:hypothetical protein